ncbi:MAG: COX15/CtaA family protein [Rhizobacter sp.]|nr:COX15/CtaA family protein [Ferruginibacter sp.]
MKKISNWVIATFILCFLVIIAGGIVRTTQSGMGCPDWPRCFGKWIPPTNASQLPADFEKYLGKQDIDHTFNAYHTWIEYINRLFGVLLGLFGIIQVWLLFSKRKTHPQAWKLSVAFLIVVILTGLFGAIVVKLNLAHFSISVHLLFAILLLQIQLALWMSVNEKFHKYDMVAGTKRMLWIFLVIIFVQSIMGTMVRMYVDDISKALNYEQRALWLADDPAIFLIHRTFSWLVVLMALWMAWLNRTTVLKKNYYALAAVILLSMTTGIVLYYAHMPAFAQPLHLLLASVAITINMYLILKAKIRTA